MNADSEQARISVDSEMKNHSQLDLDIPSPNKFCVFGEHLLWGDHEITLSGRSYKLLRCLVQAKDGFCSKNELINAGWPEDNPFGVSDKTLSEAIRRVRMQLEYELRIKGSEGFVWIRSVSGRGYRLVYPENTFV